MNGRRNNTIFWIELPKIKPNPLQPRSEFNEDKLRHLSESIRQYGVLQPLLVIRREVETDRGVSVEYELIAGERRLRAAELAGLSQVPVIIQDDMEDKIKLELAIIENLQREDLNPIERAGAFKKLINEFKLRHCEVATRIGKSREYVTNTIRLLLLPDEIQMAVVRREISEGHCRPILMLSDRKDEQIKLYQEILEKKLSVRAAERISRSIAVERARKPESVLDPETKMIEEKLSDNLGTRVMIEGNRERGRIQIDFFSNEELQALLKKMSNEMEEKKEEINSEEVIKKFTI